MRHTLVATSLLAGTLSVFAIGAAAQHADHHPEDQTTQDQTKPSQAQPGMMGGGMMMNMMGQMTTHHQQMTTLMNKLIESMKAIENEKDPAALKLKLVEHRALLEQMHTQMTQQGGMMQDMPGMMMKNCPMMDNNANPSTK